MRAAAAVSVFAYLRGGRTGPAQTALRRAYERARAVRDGVNAGVIQSMDDETLLACHECDLLQRRVALPIGGRAICPRCGAALYTRSENSIERALALLLGAAVLFVIGNAFPVVTMEMQGQITTARAWEGAWQLHKEGATLVGAMVFLTACAFPLIQIAGLLSVLVPLHFGFAPRYLVPMLRVIAQCRPWSMVEVFMLGVLVSLVKLAHLAKVIPGVGMWALFGMIVLLAWATGTLDEHEVWGRVERRAVPAGEPAGAIETETAKA